MTTTVSLGLDCPEYPEPQIEVHFPNGAHPRVLRAALHNLAADVELATPERAGWNVRTRTRYGEGGRVYLELFSVMPANVARGMALLEKCGTGGTTTSANQNPMTKIVSQGYGERAYPEPQIELRFPNGTPRRVVRAALHKLAAHVELATPAGEDWIVRTQIDDAGRARVYLDLFSAIPADVAHGMAVLKKLVD